MKTYIGVRYAAEPDTASDTRVYIKEEDGSERELDLRLDLRNHSPTGLNWGYGGSGPAQLSLALCADALGDDDRALYVYQRFKFEVIAGIPQSANWTLTDDQVREVARRLEKERS